MSDSASAPREQSFGVIPVRRTPYGRLEFLLVQHHGGHWAFPKGHPEPGEAPQQSALRELQEETGLRAERLLPTPLVEEYSFRHRGQLIHKRVTYWIGWVADGGQGARPQEEEIAQLTWGSFDRAHQRLSVPAARALLEQAQEILRRV